jgi:hypothetical protein
LIGFEKQVEQEAPVEATLLVLQEQAADYIRESKRRDASKPDELASNMLHVLARDHFRHVQKNCGAKAHFDA